jgi:hypothetical protein
MVKVKVSLNHIFKMVTLVNNMNARTVKVKGAVSNDTASIEKIVDLRKYERISKTGAGKDGKVAEGLFNRGLKGEVNIAKGDIKCGGSKAGIGADEKGWKVEEVGLEEVGGGNVGDVVYVDFKWCNSQES